MKHVSAVIGANFGDEGKGLMTDYFCSQNKKSLNIRFNGGAQAGHTVVTPDGKRHVFSHIGSGTFSGADTYLSEFFISNPILFLREYSALPEPEIYISGKSCISLPCDMMINQFAEDSRGDSRHGSCGLGIFETIMRSQDNSLKICFGDSLNGNKLHEKIKYINSIYAPKRLKDLGFENIPEKLLDLLSDDNITYNFIEDFFNMKKICHLSDDSILENYDNIVFEGAQGLLLDRDRTEYFPHLTPSNTGMKNIRNILNQFPEVNTEVCYITRSYFTRHGKGKFNSENNGIVSEFGLSDKTNQTNQYQGNFRYGLFDRSEFIKSVNIDKKYLSENDHISVCITHMDETDSKIICENENISPQNIANDINAELLYCSYGDTRKHVKKFGQIN